MKPVEGNDDFCETPGSSGLNTPASSIIWTGPDIPCIELCSGDTIDKVIYDVAKILCDITDNVLDVSKLDFKCLLSEGACLPETLLETLQIMINKSCGLNPDGTLIGSGTGTSGTDGTNGTGGTGTNGTGGTDGISTGGNPSVLPFVTLPQCLWFNNAEGDTIKSLRLDFYANYLATSICKIITDVTSINSKITTLNNQITTLTATVNGGGSGTGSTGGSSSSATIMSKCLSAPTPGQNINLTTAFENLEEKMCSYIQLIGQTSDWNALLGDECITLDTDLPDDSGKYGEIPGWFDDPQSVYESMSNLWKVVCKLNAVQTAGGGGTGTGGTGTGACTVLPVPSVFYTSATTTIAWSVPGSVVDLNAYKVIIKEQGTGTVKFQTTVAYPETSLQLLSLSIYTNNTLYNIEVIAQYDCGDAPATISPVIINPLTIDFKAVYQNNGTIANNELAINCVPTPTDQCWSISTMRYCEEEGIFPYPDVDTGIFGSSAFYKETRMKITVALTDPTTGIAKVNGTGNTIRARFCFKKEYIRIKTSFTGGTPCSTLYNNNNLIINENIDVFIANGASSGSVEIIMGARDSNRSFRRYGRIMAGFRGFYDAAGVASLTNITSDASTFGLLAVC